MLKETEFRQPAIVVSRFMNCFDKTLILFIFAGLFDNESVEKSKYGGEKALSALNSH